MKLMKNYSKPTPKIWRKLGDALLAVSTSITAYAIAEEMKLIALLALFTGVVGKFLTNFFADTDGDGIADIHE